MRFDSRLPFAGHFHRGLCVRALARALSPNVHPIEAVKCDFMAERARMMMIIIILPGIEAKVIETSQIDWRVCTITRN